MLPAVDLTATGASDAPPAARNATSSALANSPGGAAGAADATGPAAPGVLPIAYPTDPTATGATDAPPAVDLTTTGASNVPTAARNATSSNSATGSGGVVRAVLALGAGAVDAADATHSCVWSHARGSTASRQFNDYRHVPALLILRLMTTVEP